MSEFIAFDKIARFSRDVFVTEKIDGTNAQVIVEPDIVVGSSDESMQVANVEGMALYAGSRSRLITPKDDNFGFARWVAENAPELVKLGPGRHYGEWWGSGIQRGYGLTKGEKRFSLFNVHRWADDAARPACCHVVPVLERFTVGNVIDTTPIMVALSQRGSAAAPGFMNPEGIILYHVAAKTYFKKTFVKDDAGKEWGA